MDDTRAGVRASLGRLQQSRRALAALEGGGTGAGSPRRRLRPSLRPAAGDLDLLKQLRDRADDLNVADAFGSTAAVLERRRDLALALRTQVLEAIEEQAQVVRGEDERARSEVMERERIPAILAQLDALVLEAKVLLDADDATIESCGDAFALQVDQCVADLPASARAGASPRKPRQRAHVLRALAESVDGIEQELAHLRQLGIALEAGLQTAFQPLEHEQFEALVERLLGRALLRAGAGDQPVAANESNVSDLFARYQALQAKHALLQREFDEFRAAAASAKPAAASAKKPKAADKAPQRPAGAASAPALVPVRAPGTAPPSAASSSSPAKAANKAAAKDGPSGAAAAAAAPAAAAAGEEPAAPPRKPRVPKRTAKPARPSNLRSSSPAFFTSLNASGDDLFVRDIAVKSEVRAMEPCPFSRELVCLGTADGACSIVNIGDSSSEMTTVSAHSDVCQGVQAHPYNPMVATVSTDHRVKCWDVERGLELISSVDNGGIALSCSFSCDGTVLAVTGHRVINLIDYRTGRIVRSMGNLPSNIQSCAFHPVDIRLLATGGDDKLVKVIDVAQGRAVDQFGGHKRWVSKVSFSTGGDVLFSASKDKTVKGRQWSKQQLLFNLSTHQSTVHSVATSDHLLFTASSDERVRVYDASAGGLQRILRGHSGPVRDIAFLPDLNLLASGGGDQVVKIWSMNDLTNPSAAKLRGGGGGGGGGGGSGGGVVSC